MEDVIEFLKSYIWKNGFAKLSENPFAVYKAMEGIDQRTARLVMVTLMSKTHEMAQKGCSAEELVSHIQKEHFVNRKTAGTLASMYLALFSNENVRSWDEAKEAGFSQFCKNKWTLEWHGRCEWHTKHGSSYPCYAEASLTFLINDKKKLHSHLSKELKSNPFLSADEIYQILARQIRTDLDKDMRDFCDADDYYEPYFEEFIGEGTYESEARWESWGLDMTEFTCSGDVDFEP